MARENLEICLGESGLVVGTLQYEAAGGREYSCFQYASSWLDSPAAFALAPALPLGDAKHFFRGDKPFPPALMDTLPDLWGRKVLIQHSRLTGDKQRFDALFFLLSVSDFCRAGALRIRRVEKDAHFLGSGQSDFLPHLYDLNQFCSIVRGIEMNTAEAEALRQFIIPGSSLGGARPKCSILGEDNRLCLAKFTSHRDSRASERAEAATLRLARLCGIPAPHVTLVETSRKLPVAIIERFDRVNAGRIPYISAQTMLDSPTADDGTYVDIADAIRTNGIDPIADLHDLFRRILFTILISNVDDHLKNHGFLYAGSGKWRLAPIFDVNPFPEREKRLKTAIANVTDAAASVELLLEHAFYFEMAEDDAAEIIGTMANTIQENWTGLVREFGMSRAEIEGPSSRCPRIFPQAGHCYAPSKRVNFSPFRFSLLIA